MEILLGIDIGTSACKVAAFDALDGKLLAASNQTYQLYHPETNHVEQNADDWWHAVCRGVRDLIDKGVNLTQIAAIGLDGQSWAAVPLDDHGAILARTPIWMDTRATNIAAEIEAKIGAERLFSVSGNPFKANYVTPKLIYWQKYQPELVKHTAKIIGCNAFIAFRLTGAITLDYSQGYAWHCFDEARLCYDTALAEELGIPLRILPELVAPDQVVGRVTAEASRASGLPEGIPVVAGGLDAACGTLGAGVIANGQTQEQGGQAGGMSICLNKPLAHPRLILSPHIVPGHWLLQGGTVGGGGTVNWFARELGAAERQMGVEIGRSPFAIMDDEADGSPLGSRSLIYLPYMAGERSPLWDAKASGAFIGLGYDKTRADLIRAIFEGTAYALEHNIRTAREVGATISEFRAMGGAANSRIWTQIKANVTGITMSIPMADTATTLGAALAAGVGVGIYKDYTSAVAATIRIQRTQVPDPVAHEAYKPFYEIYESLYPILKATMHRLADLKEVSKT